MLFCNGLILCKLSVVELFFKNVYSFSNKKKTFHITNHRLVSKNVLIDSNFIDFTIYQSNYIGICNQTFI